MSVGILVVLVGLADVSTRASHAFFGADAARVSFGPALEALPSIKQPIIPARLDIPSIGVHASVEQVGQKPNGAMGTPKDFANVGWYSLGVKPGEAGNAVIDGHVNNALTKPGVFEHLGDLKAGDYVTVSDAQSKTLIYKVTQIERYDTQNAPLETVFARTGPSQLVLITCDGDWVEKEKSFDKRLVVYATLAR